MTPRQRADAAAQKYLLEYYDSIYSDLEMGMDIFTNVMHVHGEYGMVYRLTGESFTAYKLIPIRYVNQFERISRLISVDKKYSREVKDSIHVKHVKLVQLFNNKVRVWGNSK